MVSVVTLAGVRAWLESATVREEKLPKQVGGTLALVHHPELWLSVDIDLRNAQVQVVGGKVCIVPPVWQVALNTHYPEDCEFDTRSIILDWNDDYYGCACDAHTIAVMDLDKDSPLVYDAIRELQYLDHCGCGKLFTAYPGIERCNTCVLTKPVRERDVECCACMEAVEPVWYCSTCTAAMHARCHAKMKDDKCPKCRSRKRTCPDSGSEEF